MTGSGDPPSDPSDADDALTQMVGVLRVAAETLRFMAETGADSARPATLDAALDVEEALTKVRRAASLVSDARRTTPSGRRDRQSCH